MTKLILLLAPLLVLTAFASATLLSKNRIDTYRTGKTYLTLSEIPPQIITPQHNGLNIIFVSLKNPRLEAVSQFVFSLYGPDAKLLRQVTFSGRNISDPGDVRFQFDPIPNSQNLPLTMTITPADPSLYTKVEALIDSSDQISYRSYYQASIFNPAIKFVDPVFFSAWSIVVVILFLLSWRSHTLGGRKSAS